MTIIFFFVYLKLTLSNYSQFLSPNILKDGNFTSNLAKPNVSISFISTSSLNYWKSPANRNIDYLFCPNFYPKFCQEGYAIDLIGVQNSSISQMVNLQKGIYVLSFLLYPIVQSHQNIFSQQNIEVTLGKYLLYTINKNKINQSFKSTINFIFTGFAVEQGSYNLTFNCVVRDKYRSYNAGLAVGNISLNKKIKNLSQELQSYIISNILNELTNQGTQIINNIPALEVVFQQILSCYSHFHFYQLYMFHNRQFSRNSLLIVKSTYQNMFQIRGSFISDKILNNYKTQTQSIMNNLNYKQPLQDRYFYTNTNSTGSLSFYKYCFGSFFQNTVINIMLAVAFFVLFNILFQYKLSKLIRKFSFSLTLYFFILQNYIQPVSFFVFSQFSSFFSINFRHKMLNALIIVIFFIVCVFSICIYYLCKIFYKKLAKYFIQCKNISPKQIWQLSFNQIIVMLMFGATHQLLLNQPNLQLVALFFIQILWIINFIVYFCQKGKQDKVSIAFIILQSLLRMSFIISFYLYDNQKLDKIYINNQIQNYLIIGIFLLAALELIYGIYQTITQFLLIFKSTKINPNKKKKKHSRPKQNKLKQKQNILTKAKQQLQHVINSYYQKRKKNKIKKCKMPNCKRLRIFRSFLKDK